MPEMIGMLKPLKVEDEIEGSVQLARAVWALGRIGKPSSPAQVARTIRARTAANWEGSQAGRFFRKVFETNRFASWFVRKEALDGSSCSPRYLYDLSDHARAYFEKTWVEGYWKPHAAAEPDSKDAKVARGSSLYGDTERPFRRKNHTPEGKIKALENENKHLRAQLATVTSLLGRVHTCHHGDVEQVMKDIDAYMAGYKGVQG